MSEDPILRLAKLRIIKASADIEVQFQVKMADRPSIEILRRLRDEAAVSLAALPFLNLDDPNDLIKAKVLQNEVKRYDEWLGWMRAIISEGIEHDKQFSDEERDELLDLLIKTDAGEREAIALGLITPDDRSVQD